MRKLLFASFFTLGILGSFVFGIVTLAFLHAGSINLPVALGFTAAINILLWICGPTITDFINRYFHKNKFLTKEELAQLHPEIYAVIEQVATQYKFKFPKVGIIPDKNPTAFTYGSGRFNSRIILTEGIFHFLTPQEAKAVVAHELGHIVHRDFIVMMIASTLVQFLYQIYISLRKAKGKKAGSARLVAVGAYVLYLIGIYLIYYLSRTREYYADEFAAKITDPNDLSNALIKIAYGIVAAKDSESASSLLESTRHLGILDVKNAKHYGVASYTTHSDPNILAEVMVFDVVSPWAQLAELSSTHPLTGKRIRHLSVLSQVLGRPFSFDIPAAIERMKVDTARLYRSFAGGILVFALPLLCGILAYLYLNPVLIPLAFIAGFVLQVPYRFASQTTRETTVLDEMRNPYASPLRGVKISLSGKVIGRGVPGFIFGQDMMFQDGSGLVFLKFTAFTGAIGNFFFAIKRIKTLFDIPSRATGWFYRGMGSMMVLKNIQTEQGKVRSHPVLWAYIQPIFTMLFVGIFIFIAFGSELQTGSLLKNPQNEGSIKATVMHLFSGTESETDHSDAINKVVGAMRSETQFPVALDDITDFVAVSGTHNTIRYEYVLHDVDTSTLTQSDFERNIMGAVCDNSDLRTNILSQGIGLEYFYSVRDSQQTFLVVVNESKCLNR